MDLMSIIASVMARFSSNDGSSRFEPSPAGNHRYLRLTDEQKARTLETLILLASEPPARP